ncbi:MAG: type II toxin-antitoxin system HicB family antitoxin [Pirellulales bacterium]
MHHGFGQDKRAPGSVPVYNCHARLSRRDAEGWITARCSNLPGVMVRGKTEREALAALVAEFKAVISRYGTAGQAIPWAEAPAKSEPGEQERWIAVHL